MNGAVLGAPRAVITIDQTGTIVDFDGAAEQVFGVPRAEALGQTIADFIVPRRLGADQDRLELAIERSDESDARVLVSSRDLSGGRQGTGDSALQALLECGEEIAQTGSWDWDLDTDELLWSDNLYRLHGLEPGEITPTPGYVIERVHPDDRERVGRASNRAGRLGPLDYRIVRPNGVVRHLRGSEAVIERGHGRPQRIVGCVQDITDWDRLERAIAAYLAVAEALVDWETFEQGATGLLRRLAAALDCVAGVMWLPDSDVLVAHVIWRSDSTDVSGLESVIRQLRLPRGVGLAGQVWESGEPRNVLSLRDDPRFPAEAVAGLGGAVALSAVHEQEVLAVLEFYVRQSASVDVTDRLLRSLTGIGHELGEFLAHHHRGELKSHALTPRELEVLQLAAEGCSGPEIAERLVLSPATVRTHFENIYQKYGVSDRTAAVAKALREGLIE